jgi:hypothetical protein
MAKSSNSEPNAVEVSSAISNCREVVFYLSNYLADTVESTRDQLGLYVDTLNAYFAYSETEEFEFRTDHQERSEIHCGCGWKLRLVLADNSGVPDASGLLRECLDQMLVHKATEHLMPRSTVNGEDRSAFVESETTCLNSVFGGSSSRTDVRYG